MTLHDLHGKRVVLGITGGVAAYKAADLCRELVRAGAIVSPVLTATAERFIGASTFSALASEPARTSLWDPTDVSPHTALGQAADLVVIAPATANLLAAARAGTAHDLLTSILLATRAPVVMCPAMHTEMWEHPATQENVATLIDRGVEIVSPAEGELAGGDSGVGRLAPVEEILGRCADVVRASRRSETPTAVVGDSEASPGSSLAGLHVLVSAGGTREPIDPVRFVGNRSSGKQGHAIATAADARGAKVTLVTTADLPVPAGVRTIKVETAESMRAALLAEASVADVVVMSAAVADFRPTGCSDHKLKRRDGIPNIVLEPTPDILSELVAQRAPHQSIVGFGAETNDIDANASRKLEATGVDLLVVNDVSAPGVGFEYDTNAVTIHWADRRHPSQNVSLCSKRRVADQVLDAVLELRTHAAPTSVPHLREVR